MQVAAVACCRVREAMLLLTVEIFNDWGQMSCPFMPVATYGLSHSLWHILSSVLWVLIILLHRIVIINPSCHLLLSAEECEMPSFDKDHLKLTLFGQLFPWTEELHLWRTVRCCTWSHQSFCHAQLLTWHFSCSLYFTSLQDWTHIPLLEVF